MLVNRPPVSCFRQHFMLTYIVLLEGSRLLIFSWYQYKTDIINNAAHGKY